MAIEIVDFPSYKMVIFHSYVKVSQRVTKDIFSHMFHKFHFLLNVTRMEQNASRFVFHGMEITMESAGISSGTWREDSAKPLRGLAVGWIFVTFGESAGFFWIEVKKTSDIYSSYFIAVL